MKWILDSNQRKWQSTISSWNFHDVCQRFLYNQEQNSSWIGQKMRNFPIESHTMSIDMTLQKWSILQWGSMGKIFVFWRIQLKFRSWLYKKRWHTPWTFQLEIISNKKVIAKKPLTNLCEMNSRFKYTFDSFHYMLSKS